jgi:hypothetical protein
VRTGYRTNAAGADGHQKTPVMCGCLSAAISAWRRWLQFLLTDGRPGVSPVEWRPFAALGIAVFGLLVGLLAAEMALSVAVGVAAVLMVLARKSSGAIRRGGDGD